MIIETLVIGGIEIPRYALSDTFNQTYEDMGGRSLRRKLNGAALVQQNWVKLRTVISGGGAMPAPLAGLIYDSAYEVRCAQVASIASAANVITLPAGRRSDGIHAPAGYALVEGLLVPTSMAIVDDEATLVAVAGAQHYAVHYYPQFTGHVTHSHGGDPWAKTMRWSVTIEEA